MIKKFRVIPVPTKENTNIILITKGICAGGLVKKEYYGMLNEDMGDTYVHLFGISEDEIKQGDVSLNLDTNEIYECKAGDYVLDCERKIEFSTNSSLQGNVLSTIGVKYFIPTIHHSTYTCLIQQYNNSDEMWLEVVMENPKTPEHTDDVHFDAVMFDQWLRIKDKWFIKNLNNIVVVKEKDLETTHSNNAASNCIQDSKIKGDDAKMVLRTFKAGMDYINTQLPPDTEWNYNSKIKPSTGGEYNVVWKLNDGEYPVTSSMDWDAIKNLWTDPRNNDCEVNEDVLYWKKLPEPPKLIDEKLWKL